LRWREPQPVRPWHGVLKADRFSPSAMQGAPGAPDPESPWAPEFNSSPPVSEDCLYLNVWSGAKHAGEKRPVIVWIHGGAFVGGSGAVPIYDGEAMARNGVVFVTINYRVGIFGFFAHPALTAESPHASSGNYGILDQLAALRWVHENVAAFGGDPENVTIAGQSAGACSVHTLVASPLSAGLFRRAIAESGFFSAPDQLATLHDAELDGAAVMGRRHAQTLAEMRALSAEELVKDYPMHLPVVDGYLLPAQIREIFRRRREQPVDVLLGYNANDAFTEIVPASAYREQSARRYDERTDAFLALYPATNDSVAAASQRNLARDRTFAVQAYEWAKWQMQSGRHKAWLYYFERVPPGKPDFGAYHSYEIPYALGNLARWRRPFSPLDYRLSEQMSRYWVNFSRTGDPNGGALPKWPVFRPVQTRVQRLADRVESIAWPAQEALRFLAGQEDAPRSSRR
jgi:para-nitrobenzyl esterase